MIETVGNGDAMSDISNGVVGWTIKKIDPKVVNLVKAIMKKGQARGEGHSFHALKTATNLSTRDLAGVISYILSKELVSLSPEQRKKWASEVFNKAKVGEVTNRREEEEADDTINKVAVSLLRGEGVTVVDIIEYLHWFMEDRVNDTSKTAEAARIAVDELEKYMNRDEVGMVGAAIMKVAGKPVAKEVYKVLKEKGLLSTIEKAVK